MYNQLDEFVGKSLRLYGEFSQGEADLFDQIVKPGHIVSYNVLCLPKDSPIQLQGFAEVAEGSCVPAAVLPGNGTCANRA